ncbi:MAG TPA: hypothetical protein VGU63_06755 [Candidatus Acidoferrales bacterium]|nr:hypothetical protein [Candidatus Acidoferrales bacterium]
MIRAQQQELTEQRKALDEQQKEIHALQEQDRKASSPAPSVPVPAVSKIDTSATNTLIMHDTESSSATHAAPAAKVEAAKQMPAGEAKENRLSDLAHGKVHLGATFFGDYSYYTDTGFGPQWYDNVNQDGPGNRGANSFNVTRTYLDVSYTPNEYVTLRVTPDIYRQINGSAAALTNGTGAQIGATSNGNLTFRLKYAYVDFNQLFKSSEKFTKDKLTFGQTTNPLVDWEEGLSGYRYAYLVPWNYLSLSSTHVGVKLHGPIEMNGKEYLDYDLGVFTTASFHSIETSDKKQVMARLTWYPLGTTTDRTGFGMTFFENYGYDTKFPSQISTPLNRIAILGHFQTHNKAYEIVGEYDLGRNAFSTGNLFSGTAPVAGGNFDAFNTLAGSVLSGNRTRQQGFDFFGHARLGHSQFALWGFYQYCQPNTHFVGTDPLEFARTVGGISYKVNQHFDFAFGDENFHWLHQSLVAGGDTNAIAIWTQFNY